MLIQYPYIVDYYKTADVDSKITTLSGVLIDWANIQFVTPTELTTASGDIVSQIPSLAVYATLTKLTTTSGDIVAQIPSLTGTGGIITTQNGNVWTVDGSSISGTGTTGSGVAQVNSDWNAISGLSQILNKPTLLTPSGVILTGTQSSRPAAGTAGRVYFPNDGYYPSKDTGSVWVPQPQLGASYQVSNPPAANTFTAAGGGAETTLVADGDGLLLTQMGTNDTTIRNATYLVAVPTAPYKFVVGFEVLFAHPIGSSAFGICLSNGTTPASNNLVTFAIGINTGVSLLGWNDWIGTITTYFNYSAGGPPFGLCRMYLRFYDNNTNRYSQVSIDGRNWATLWVHTRTTYITPTYCGIFGLMGWTGIPTTSTHLQVKIFHWYLGT